MYDSSQGHEDVVSGVAYNPRLPQLVTAGYDGKLRCYTEENKKLPKVHERNNKGGMTSRLTSTIRKLETTTI